ncbi:hypothetical protein L2E82_03875 [Cichorium intybus]|uniref:Uncharacterized protein n=1 Tax=Cichorium intybus TaxID=13427 RepID=A0ACB9H5N0_CICIN|nr:hypothetical protein L2E82_03875 [Cichorium intybus]
MEKSERPKASKREDGVDLISSMPDDILVLILSRLRHTEEVIRSSILSRRWRYLWTSIPFVDVYCFRGSKNEKNFKKSKFKEFVYWVLVNKSTDLDRFELYCSDYYSMSTVGRWIHAAVTRNVKQLDLGFCLKDSTEVVEMPHCLVTCGSLEDFDGDYDSLDEAETRKMWSSDVKRVDVFEFNGVEPDLCIHQCCDKLVMFFTWRGRNKLLS